MSGLLIKYSKEIAKELTKIAVVLPGTPVDLGDIINFPFGNKSIFKIPSPTGSFEVINNLNNMKIKPVIDYSDKEGDTYIYSSQESVSIEGSSKGKADISSELSLGGNLSVAFNEIGSIYFVAVGCLTHRITNIDQIQVNLKRYNKDLLWENTYLVTSITLAKRALIMQSSSEKAFLELSGDIEGLKINDISKISDKSEIKINKVIDASFIKSWSRDVIVFFGLHRFQKKTFGFTPKEEGKTAVDFEDYEFEIIPVSVSELL
jgi:hypothetical protein